MFKIAYIHSLISVNTPCACGKGKFRRLDYPNRSALDKSCEKYNFDRCFPAVVDAKKDNTRVTQFFL